MANKCLLAALLLVAATSSTLVGAWQDSALFAELDDNSLTIQQVESILESAEEDAEVGSIEVKDILALKSAQLADCEKDKLWKYVNFHHQVRHNKGVVKYIDSKVRSLLELCAKNLDAIKAEHETQFDQTDREYIRGLAGVLPKVESASGFRFGQSARAIDKFIASLPGKKDHVKKAQKMRLIGACKHLVGLLETPALIVFEARRRDIPAESDRDASWDLAHKACQELIFKSKVRIMRGRG